MDQTDIFIELMGTDFFKTFLAEIEETEYRISNVTTPQTIDEAILLVNYKRWMGHSNLKYKTINILSEALSTSTEYIAKLRDEAGTIQAPARFVIFRIAALLYNHSANSDKVNIEKGLSVVSPLIHDMETFKRKLASILTERRNNLDDLDNLISLPSNNEVNNTLVTLSLFRGKILSNDQNDYIFEDTLYHPEVVELMLYRMFVEQIKQTPKSYQTFHNLLISFPIREIVSYPSRQTQYSHLFIMELIRYDKINTNHQTILQNWFDTLNDCSVQPEVKQELASQLLEYGKFISDAYQEYCDKNNITKRFIFYTPEPETPLETSDVTETSSENSFELPDNFWKARSRHTIEGEHFDNFGIPDGLSSDSFVKLIKWLAKVEIGYIDGNHDNMYSFVYRFTGKAPVLFNLMPKITWYGDPAVLYHICYLFVKDKGAKGKSKYQKVSDFFEFDQDDIISQKILDCIKKDDNDDGSSRFSSILATIKNEARNSRNHEYTNFICEELFNAHTEKERVPIFKKYFGLPRKP